MCWGGKVNGDYADRSAVRGGTSVVGKVAHFGSHIDHPHISDEVISAERTDFNAKGERIEGFASSAVPTLEEKTIMEGRPHKQSIAGASHSQHSLQTSSFTSGSSSIPNGSEHALADVTLNGASGGKMLDECTPRASEDMEGEQPRAASEPKSTLRKHASRRSSRNWSVNTPRPYIHADDFEDPISDTFWKDKWVSSAVHNVRVL